MPAVTGHGHAHGANDSYAVPPGSVYVWRGFKSPTKTYEQFAEFLGGVFVPACALLQPPVGLRAYLPTMVLQNAKPAAVPDQTALMFWATPESHDLADRAIAVRIYQNLHGDAYDLQRSHTPEVPVSIACATGTLVAEQPYFLIDAPADWMLGDVHHLVAARRPETTAADFLAQVHAWATALHAAPPDGANAALLCCGTDYVVAWVHGVRPGAALARALDPIAALSAPVLRASPRATTLPAGLWSDWPGLDLINNPCINLQFARLPAASTVPALPVHR
jgi:hypothetical protein